MNNRLNKMSDFMKENLSDAEGRALGLSKYDIAQAKEQFEKGTGTKLGDSVKDAREKRKKRKERNEQIKK